ncbi:hypothetical protein AAVH_31012 [Aphelenchoides avenae]|nr:hypothetical protein AAVH_31012 [Aphelenchus avenae]
MRFPEGLWNELTGAKLAQMGATDSAASFLRIMPVYKQIVEDMLFRIDDRPGSSDSARKRQNENRPQGGKKANLGGKGASKPPSSAGASKPKVKSIVNRDLTKILVVSIGDCYKKVFFADSMKNLSVVEVDDVEAMRKYITESIDGPVPVLFLITEWALTADGVKEFRDLAQSKSTFFRVVTRTVEGDISVHRKMPAEGENFRVFGKQLLKEMQEANYIPLSRVIA